MLDGQLSMESLGGLDSKTNQEVRGPRRFWGVSGSFASSIKESLVAITAASGDVHLSSGG